MIFEQEEIMSQCQVTDEQIAVDITYFNSTEQVSGDVDKRISCFIRRFPDGS